MRLVVQSERVDGNPLICGTVIANRHLSSAGIDDRRVAEGQYRICVQPITPGGICFEIFPIGIAGPGSAVQLRQWQSKQVQVRWHRRVAGRNYAEEVSVVRALRIRWIGVSIWPLTDHDRYSRHRAP